MRWGSLVATCLLLTTFASADEVVLENGRRITGVVIEETPTTVVVDIGAGQVGFPRAGVARIVRAPSALAHYRQRAASLRPADLQGWLELALWARERELQTGAAEAFARVLSLEPDHAGAREALGYQHIGGEWLAGDDLNRARGLVPFEGQWVTPAEQSARLAEREADRRQRREAAESAARRAEAEARAREAEARARQAAEPPPPSGGIYLPWAYGGGSSSCRRGRCDDEPRPQPTTEPEPPPRPQTTPRPPRPNPPPPAVQSKGIPCRGPGCPDRP